MNGPADFLADIPDGTRLLCVGPPLSGKQEFSLGLVETAAQGRWGIVITTDAPAAFLVEEYPDVFDDRTVIIDCTGTETDPDGVTRLTVASAADLTGIAMAVSKALSMMEAAGAERPVVVVDSLTSLSLYTDFDRLYRFVHGLSQQVADHDGLLVATIDDDAVEERAITTLMGTVDARVEFRNRVEFRVVGLASDLDGWTSMAPEVTASSAGAESPDADETGGGTPPAPWGSLRGLIESVTAEGPTLTLCNVDEASEAVASVSDHVRQLNVTVELATLSTDRPVGVALLHREGDLVAASSVDALAAAIDGDDSTGMGMTMETEQPDVLRAITHDVFGADGVDRSVLIRASRTVERLALAGSGGRLDAAFQRLSNLAADEQTMRVYEELAVRGVDVHVYGEADVPVETLPDLTYHGLPHEELVDAWFVVYDGGGDPDRAGALVTEQTGPNAYDGFWTYQPERSAQIASFVSDRYDPA